MLLGRSDRGLLAQWWFTVDRGLMFAVLLLMSAGVLISMAASPPVAERIGVDTFHFIKSQLFYLVLAVPLLVALSFFKPRMARRAGLIVFEQSLWDALPRYVRSLDRALQAATGHGLPIDAAPVRFGSWIGGDRDGNPNVTPTVTRRACLLSRWAAASLYLPEIDAVRDEQGVSDADLLARRQAVQPGQLRQ